MRDNLGKEDTYNEPSKINQDRQTPIDTTTKAYKDECLYNYRQKFCRGHAIRVFSPRNQSGGEANVGSAVKMR